MDNKELSRKNPHEAETIPAGVGSRPETRGVTREDAEGWAQVDAALEQSAREDREREAGETVLVRDAKDRAREILESMSPPGTRNTAEQMAAGILMRDLVIASIREQEKKRQERKREEVERMRLGGEQIRRNEEEDRRAQEAYLRNDSRDYAQEAEEAKAAGVDVFAPQEPPKKTGFMQRLAAWSGLVIGGANLLRLAGGVVGDRLEEMEMHKTAAHQAAEVAGDATFTSGELRYEVPEAISAEQRVEVVRSMEALAKNNLGMDASQAQEFFTEGSFAYNIFHTLAENGGDVSKTAENVEFSSSQVRGFANEYYGLYAEREVTMGVLKDTCGEQIEAGRATSDTVKLDALKCFDVYGDASRLGPPADLKPIIAAGNGLSLEEMRVHHDLVAGAMIEEGDTVTARFYGMEHFPEKNGVFSSQEDMEPMLKETFGRTVEMASWSVKEGGVMDMSPDQRADFGEAFTGVVHKQIENQQAWYALGAGANGMAEVNGAGEMNAIFAAETGLPKVLQTQDELRVAWANLAGFESGAGPLHHTADMNISAESGKAASFYEHAVGTGVHAETWQQELDRLHVAREGLAVTEDRPTPEPHG